MLNKLNELRKGKEEGFTLIELLVVILIIGVLSAIALPIFLNQQQEAAKASVKADVRNTVTQVATWVVGNPSTAIPAENWTNDGSASQPTSNEILLVASKGNTIDLTPGSKTGDYIVTGSSSGVDNWEYTYDSSTGQYL